MRIVSGLLIFLTSLSVGTLLFAAPPPAGYPYGPKSDWLSGGRVVASPQTGFKTLALQPSAQTLTGQPWKTLLILIDFPDVPRKGSPAYFKDMLFAHHPTVPTGKELYEFTTVADLYARMSGGTLTFGETTVVGWFEAPKPYTYYSQYDGTNDFQGCHGLGAAMNGFNSGAQQLLALALGEAEAQGVNLADFNNVIDGATGQPDGVFLVHAGPGGEQTAGDKPCVKGATPSGGDLWSHEYYVAHGDKIVHYLLGPAESASKSTRNGLSAAGVWAHEFGHMLNLPDLYAPTSETGHGVGCWDLMGYGIRSCWSEGYTGDEPGHDPQEMSVWTRQQMEWAAPRAVADNLCNRRIDPVVYGGETFKVTPDPDQPHDYFLVEYRAAVGQDQDLLPPTASENRNRVCIWHIDDGQASAFSPNEGACYPNEDRAACAEEHYGVALVQPDRNYSLEKGVAYAEAGDCLGPNAEMTSALSDDAQAGTNYDLWPWQGKPASHWTVRTGSLEEKATVTILVNDQVQAVAPQIEGTPRDADRGKTWKFQPVLAEGAGMPLWSLLRYPRGMTIDTDTGLISWRVPKSFSAEKVLVELRVENCGGSDTQKFNLYLIDEDEGFFARCGIAGRRGVAAADTIPYLFLLAAWVWKRRRRAFLVTRKHQL